MVDMITTDLKVDVGTWVAVRTVPGKRHQRIREHYYKVKGEPLSIPKASVLEFTPNIYVKDMPEGELKVLAIRTFGIRGHIHILEVISATKDFTREHVKITMMVPYPELMGVE